MWFKKLVPFVAVMGMAFSINLMAASPQQIDAPEALEPLQSGEPLGSEVTIQDSATETVYEYRRNGQLFMVKVQPKAKGAPPYFFVDHNGDGNLQYSAVNPQDAMNVNQWVLFRW